MNYFENQRENQRADALRKADTERADALVEAENRRARAQQEIEDDRARQTALQLYLQDMADLLLHEGLAKPRDNNPVRQIARANTLATISQLDADRKGVLLQFLYTSDLIGGEFDPIIFLGGANLSGANLSDANLRGAELGGADLSGANLGEADLSGANLSGANLGDAVAHIISPSGESTKITFRELSGARLFSANLSGANLRGADLRETNLRGTFLGGANLRGADLRETNLRGTFLGGADLRGADLSGTPQVDANLRVTYSKGADLSSAKGWTSEQLAQAESLVRATLPDGTVMTEQAWEEFKKRYGQ